MEVLNITVIIHLSSPKGNKACARVQFQRPVLKVPMLITGFGFFGNIFMQDNVVKEKNMANGCTALPDILQA